MAQMQKKKYICKFCGDIYLSGCALGGHISKVHRGVGDKYTKKTLKRDEKFVERERSKFFKNPQAVSKGEKRAYKKKKAV